MALVKYFLLEQEEFLPEIQKGLEQKLDVLVMRELYTKYKVALTEDKELHSFVFVDRRRLGAKKARVSSRKSFSFFKRRISFSCSLTCWRSWIRSS